MGRGQWSKYSKVRLEKMYRKTVGRLANYKKSLEDTYDFEDFEKLNKYRYDVSNNQIYKPNLTNAERNAAVENLQKAIRNAERYDTERTFNENKRNVALQNIAKMQRQQERIKREIAKKSIKSSKKFTLE